MKGHTNIQINLKFSNFHNMRHATHITRISFFCGDKWLTGRRGISRRKMGGKSQFNLIDDLAFRYPVIVGLDMPGQNMGHAYVLTAIFFYYDQNQRKVPVEVVLRDPWPKNQSRTVLKWNDFFNRINCIVHVYPQNFN
jgi:hypothetical protein